jgi:hypothetical protein
MLAASKTASVSGGYQISRSLRFNSADSAYLNRTPASAGNRQIWTISFWLKRTTLAVRQEILGNADSSALNGLYVEFLSDDTLQIGDYATSSWNWQFQTYPVYRDPSAWYHIVISVDTTQATNTNRVKIYVNNTQVTVFNNTVYPSLNFNCAWNTTQPASIGRNGAYNSLYNNGYLTEIYNIDGSQLTPSSFGETNAQTGVWQPKAYSGSYGTNGFYLNFSDNSALTTSSNVGIGKDYSGNGNYFATNNISITAGAGNDSLVDSPTSYGTDTGVGGTVRGNYATLNPLLAVNNTAQTYSNGNLQITDNGLGSTNGFGVSTIDMPSGKWYVEATVTAVGTGATFGIWQQPILATTTFSSQTNYRWYSVDGKIYNAAGATANSYATWGTGDVLSVAVDMDAGSVTFYKNGTSQGSAITGLTGSWVVGFNPGGSNSIFNANFGQRPFAYTAPSGFKALCTQNLPTPTIGATTATQAGKYFNAVTYTGTGSSLGVTGVGFQPDWVWVKGRSGATDHGLYDAVRGVQKQLESNGTGAETTETTGITAFDSDGFTTGALAQLNTSSATYVAWNWKANGSGSSNTAGSITSTVSASTTSGFSVVTYTGTGANATVGHGLGVAPSMIIVKSRTGSPDVPTWRVYHASVGATKYLELNSTGSATTYGDWNNTAPTSTVFSVGAPAFTPNNQNGINYVAYCFAPVAGYSAFGSYTGNGSADGPFVFTGFRPAYVMIKNTTLASAWIVYDNKRNTANVETNYLLPNSSGAEATLSSLVLDFTSNGFKIRGDQATINTSNNNYIFACFAESPFKYSLAR